MDTMEYQEIAEAIHQLNFKITEAMNRPETFATAEGAAKLLLQVRAPVEAIGETFKMLTSLHDLLRHSRVPEAFQQARVPSIRVGDYRLTRVENLYAGYREGTKPAALEWLRRNELGDIIQDFIPAPTLAATAKGLMQENQQLPDDLFNVHIKPNITVTKVKP